MSIPQPAPRYDYYQEKYAELEVAMKKYGVCRNDNNATLIDKPQQVDFFTCSNNSLPVKISYYA